MNIINSSHQIEATTLPVLLSLSFFYAPNYWQCVISQTSPGGSINIIPLQYILYIIYPPYITYSDHAHCSLLTLICSSPLPHPIPYFSRQWLAPPPPVAYRIPIYSIIVWHILMDQDIYAHHTSSGGGHHNYRSSVYNAFIFSKKRKLYRQILNFWKCHNRFY